MAEGAAEDSMRSDGGFMRRLLTVVAVTTLTAALVLAVVYAVDVVLLLFAGGLFACFLHGLARAISSRTRLSYRMALSAVAILLVVLCAGTMAYLAPQIGEQAGKLADELRSTSKDLYAQAKESELMSRLPDRLRDPGKWLPADTNALQAIGGVFSSVVGAVTGLVVVVFIGLYLAADPGLYVRGLLALVPPAQRERGREVLGALNETMWWWILGRLASMTIIGVLITLGLWLMGIPVPVALGILAAVLTFIPNLGPLLALIPPALLALRDGPMWAVAVIAFYLAVQAVESYVITPLIQQRAVSLPPVIIIASQLLLGFFTGILGLALATPLAAMVMVLTRELYVHDVLEADADGSSAKGRRASTG